MYHAHVLLFILLFLPLLYSLLLTRLHVRLLLVLLNKYSVLNTSVAESLACWTKAQKGLGSNRSRDAVW